MSTHTTLVTSGARLQDWSVSPAMPDLLTCENIDQCLQKAREFELCSAFEVGEKIGSLVRTLELEKLQLESENRKLQADITQLKVVHAAELNAAVDKREAKKRQIAAKLEFIVAKVSAFCTKWCQNGFSLFDLNQFRALSNAVTKITYDDLRVYPTYSDVRNNPSPPKDVVTVHTRDESFLSQTPPVLLPMIRKPMGKYEALKGQIAPMRAANLALINTKEMMTHFHARHLQTIHASQREERFENSLATIRSVYNQVKWGMPTMTPQQCPECYPTSYVDQTACHAVSCSPLIAKKMKKIQGLMLDLISSLESFINPQPGGK